MAEAGRFLTSSVGAGGRGSHPEVAARPGPARTAAAGAGAAGEGIGV